MIVKHSDQIELGIGKLGVAGERREASIQRVVDVFLNALDFIKNGRVSLKHPGHNVRQFVDAKFVSDLAKAEGFTEQC